MGPRKGKMFFAVCKADHHIREEDYMIQVSFFGFLIETRMSYRSAERREPEWISTILDAENAKQETIHDEDDATPHEDCDLLNFGVCNTGNL